MHVQQVEGSSVLKWVCETVPFANGRYMKGLPFLSVMVYKRVKLDGKADRTAKDS